jgi:hypothetical protein
MATAWTWSKRMSLALLFGMGLTLLGGCSGGPRRVPVKGDVTLDGEPLDGGVLYYFADTAKGNEHRIAAVGPVRSGKYNIMTSAVKDSESGPGAPLGWYKVYMDATVPGFNTKIHDRFTDPNKTPISVEVVDNPSAGTYDIKLTSK